MERFHVLLSQKHWLGLSTVIVSNLTKLKVVSKNILLYFEILSIYEKNMWLFLDYEVKYLMYLS